jgi:phosphoglucosamine mutase
MKKFFGTDGIRGEVGKYPITPNTAMHLGYAAGRVLRNEMDDSKRALVLIGKDTRISGYMFESALEAGFSAAGVDIGLLGPMPTPAVAYLTRTLRADAGVVISASHNPFQDNGFKFFSANGAKLSDKWELEVERFMDESMETVPSLQLGKARRIDDAPGRYIEFCKSSLPLGFSLHGIKLVLDCANGASYATAPAIFEELGAEVVTIGDQPDGVNINREVGSTYPELLAEQVKSEQADFGIALDGDGDRCIMTTKDGKIVDGDLLLYIIARSRQNQQSLSGPVVGTLMSNLGVEHALKKMGVNFMRSDVGDRYVLEMLQQNGGTIGGESSGHILCLDRTTTGDGVVSALQVLFEIVESGKTLEELVSEVTLYPQVMVNVKVAQRGLPNSEVIDKAIKESESILGDRGRVLLRASGTEPLIRVMVEGESMDEVEVVVEELAAVVRKEVGKTEAI